MVLLHANEFLWSEIGLSDIYILKIMYEGILDPFLDIIWYYSTSALNSSFPSLLVFMVVFAV